MIKNFVKDNQDTSKYKGKKNNDKKKIKPPKKISDRYLYNSGLAYLQRFPASSMHFRNVMMRKINKSCRHHTEQNIDECCMMLDKLITQFKDLALLDDDAYLKGMITSLRRRGLSSLQIYNKLQQKGYKRNEIETQLKHHDHDEYETENEGDLHAALIFARKKKLGPFDVLKKRDPEKALATMGRAGYSYDVAQKTLTTNINDLPEEFKNFL